MATSPTTPETTTTPPPSPSVAGAGIKVGYARVSTSGQDLTAQRHALAALGVEEARVYIGHGLTGTNRARPGLREALAACRSGDTLVVAKPDRLARSLSDARDTIYRALHHQPANDQAVGNGAVDLDRTS